MMINHRRIFLISIVLLSAVSFTVLRSYSQSRAEHFAEGIIETASDEYGPAFTPDGKTVYFTRRNNRRDSEFIYFSQLSEGRWSVPQVAPFSGKYFDKEPFVSPDGKQIFFASLRPVN